MPFEVKIVANGIILHKYVNHSYSRIICITGFPRRHPTAPTEADSVSGKLCCLAGAFLVKVQAHHSTPLSTTLVEGDAVDWLQCTSVCRGSEVPHQRTLSASRHRGSIADCPPYTVNDLFQLPALISGTVFHSISRQQRVPCICRINLHKKYAIAVFPKDKSAEVVG